MVKTTTRPAATHRKRKATFDPFTPIRKLFSSKSSRTDNIQTPIRVRKRRRGPREVPDDDEGEQSSSPMDPVVPTPPASSSPSAEEQVQCSAARSPHQHATPNRVALQNDDDEVDAVVITALDTIPFCCHEDLLAMSRAQLVATAHTLNAKLPTILHIDTGNTDKFIRNSIEVLVGIRKADMLSPPSAPKADKSRHSRSFSGVGEMDGEEEGDSEVQLEILLNMSPLAKRGRRVSAYGSPCATPTLPRLIEEEEDADRPFKRRRVSGARNDPEDVEMDESTPLRNRSAGIRGPSAQDESPTLRKRPFRMVSSPMQASPALVKPRYRRNSDVVWSSNGKSWSPRGARVNRNEGYRASSLSVAHGPL
ncbi:hypothetical protein V5O48_000744 [Marasmius crinis-equi]|uniref:Uncharacterized protein n=1 Tax=Marasmius crinis-equi TaxID=585013 RepID=A0ABR3G1E1_9AGAR